MADQLIISYDFNYPLTQFANQGSAGAAFDAVTVLDGVSGQPAKDRGLYFDSVGNGYVPIDNLYLSHTFSIHSWILTEVHTDSMTLFWQDRDAGFDTGLYRALKVGFESNLEVRSHLALDADPLNL